MQSHIFRLLQQGRVLALSTILAATVGAFSLALPSVAAPAKAPVKGADVKAQLKAFRVVGDKLVAADSANPGDIIEYQARYTNEGSGSAQKFAPQMPIPGALVYAHNSASPANVLASTDGKSFAPAPLQRTVKNADGTVKIVAVPLSQYRALRWQLGTLAPGESVVVKVRARVKSFGDAKE